MRSELGKIIAGHHIANPCFVITFESENDFNNHALIGSIDFFFDTYTEIKYLLIQGTNGYDPLSNPAVLKEFIKDLKQNGVLTDKKVIIQTNGEYKIFPPLSTVEIAEYIIIPDLKIGDVKNLIYNIIYAPCYSLVYNYDDNIVDKINRIYIKCAGEFEQSYQLPYNIYLNVHPKKNTYIVNTPDDIIEVPLYKKGWYLC